jgi:hypothetical protein
MKTDIFNDIKIETHVELNNTVVDNINFVIEWIKKFAPEREHAYSFEMLTDNVIAYNFLYRNEKLMSFTSVWKRSFYGNNARILNRFTNLYDDNGERQISHGRRYLKPETGIIVSRQIEECLKQNIDFVFMTREGKNAIYKLNSMKDYLNFSFLCNKYVWLTTDKRYQVAPSNMDNSFQYICYSKIGNNNKFSLLDNLYRE